ncbi:acetylornithine transaminase [Marinagarivorans algicola]|uniref:acetylornithine transaminase n=1 Tax=Marinagarivorans algicola TaxID=1513270 RepID=UPI0006B91658|nr:acetylornithine transaminase [Marinagarivorans algicola]
MSLMNTYGERAITLTKGDGAYVWDDQGRRYLDGLSGIAVCGLGHCHHAVSQAINEQANALVHVSNLYLVKPQVELAQRLVDVAGMDCVFFSNSGAEANEAAIKIARKYGNDKGISAPHIITAHSSFHGRTMATLTATGNDKIKAGFTPLIDGFSHVPFDDIAAIKAAATANTVAVMMEPIQGEGGVHVPHDNYLTSLRALCDENNWLLILDEIQTGNGRTGSYFAYQQRGILPDVVTTAKGLANGMPLGACLARGIASTVLQPGHHGSTFGGNPVACAAACATVNTILTEDLCHKAGELGRYFIARFRDALSNNPHVVDIRGQGLMLGIELDTPCADIVTKAMQQQLLLNVTAGNTIRLLPPLILNKAQADDIITLVVQLIHDFYA